MLKLISDGINLLRLPWQSLYFCRDFELLHTYFRFWCFSSPWWRDCLTCA